MILAILMAIAALPVIERPATAHASDAFAVVITGDGGWRKVDAAIADRLCAAGMPVVGFLSSDYFRTRRTADETARDVEEVIRSYRSKWKKERVILVGYSRGADVLPFVVTRLPPDMRPALVALLGVEHGIDFKFNPWWTPARYFQPEPQTPVMPELQKLRGMNVLCVYGEKETDSLCPSLDTTAFRVLREPGGHHFGGRYAEIGDAIVKAVPPPPGR